MSAPVVMNLAVWFGNLERDLDALLSDMFQLCAAADSNRYAETAVNKAGIIGVVIPDPTSLGDTAPQRSARNAFIAAMSKFSEFLDRLIASQRVAATGI